MLKLLLQRSDLALDICLLLLISGAILLGSQRFRKFAKGLIISGILLIILLTNGIIPSRLLLQIENQYPTLQSVAELGSSAQKIQYIVVLGGLSNQQKEWPLTSQMGPTMLMRLTEGIRLSRELQKADLVLSGGSRSGISDAEMMQKLSIDLGVDPKKILLETKSTCTAEEAIFLKELLEGEKFILVTSARHMPRAMTLFRHIGLDPIPAPTGHLVERAESVKWRDLIPRSGNMTLFTHVLYEYLGFLKAQLANHI